MMDVKATEDVVTEDVLKAAVFGMEPEDDLPERDGRIPVCAGEWRREPDGRWRFWENEED
jgi:hypothetical protein